MQMNNKNYEDDKRNIDRKWNKSDENVISQLFLYEDISSKDIVVTPGEQLLLIKDGRIRDTLTQTKIKRIKGGVTEHIKMLFGNYTDVELLLVDTSEKKLMISFGENKRIEPLSADSDIINGSSTMFFNIDTENVHRLYSQTKNAPNRILSIKDMKRNIRREILNKVLVPKLAHYPTSTLREVRIQEDLENIIQVETGRFLDRYGIVLLNFTTEFERTSEESMKKAVRDVDLGNKEEILTKQSDAGKVSDIYGIEIDKTEKQETRYDSYKDGRFERDIKDIHRSSEKRIEDIDSRFNEEAELINKGSILDTNRMKHRHFMEEEEGSHAKTMVKKKVEIEDIEREQERKDFELINQMKSTRNERKIKRKRDKSDIRVKEFQGTDMKMKEIDAETERFKYEAEVHKAKYNAENIEKAWEKSDKKTSDMMDKMASIVQAQKPEVPHTLLQGNNSPVNTRLNISDNENGITCSNCGYVNHKKAKFCDECDEKLF